MTIAADVLRDMIIQTEQQEEDINKSISNIDDQIADLQKKTKWYERWLLYSNYARIKCIS